MGVRWGTAVTDHGPNRRGHPGGLAFGPLTLPLSGPSHASARGGWNSRGLRSREPERTLGRAKEPLETAVRGVRPLLAPEGGQKGGTRPLTIPPCAS